MTRDDFIAIHSTVVQTTPTPALVEALRTADKELATIIRREMAKRGVACSS